MKGVQRVYVLALLALALGFGVLWGLRSQPPTETDIINAAAAYVAETGGAPTDCAARPVDVDGVWLVVICADGLWVMAYDRRGRAVRPATGSLDGAPRT